MQNVLQAAPEKLIRSCLYNWLGYGNISGDLWFVLRDEGGAEIWKRPPEFVNGLSTRERIIWSLTLRYTFSISMDFHYVWKGLYRYSDDSLNKLMRGGKGNANVWRPLAAIILYHRETLKNGINDRDRKEAINAYLCNDFGSSKTNYFICEFLPLPRRSEKHLPREYALWKTQEEYREKMMKNRMPLILEALENSNAKVIVSFDTNFSKQLMKYVRKSMFYPFGQKKKQEVHFIQIGKKEVVLVDRPFPVRTGYKEIPETSSLIRRFIPKEHL